MGDMKRRRIARRSRALGASTGFYVVDRRGRYLLDPEAAPVVWNDRRGMVFATEAAAQRVIAQRFVGPTVARELLGLRTVPVSARPPYDR